MSSSVKFSNNSLNLHFTASVNVGSNPTKVSQLAGYSTSAIAGKTVDQIEILSSTGGNQKLTVKAPGQPDKTAVSPAIGNNIINYSPAQNADSLSVVAALNQ